jgi:hypothetical protein
MGVVHCRALACLLSLPSLSLSPSRTRTHTHALTHNHMPPPGTLCSGSAGHRGREARVHRRGCPGHRTGGRVGQPPAGQHRRQEAQHRSGTHPGGDQLQCGLLLSRFYSGSTLTFLSRTVKSLLLLLLSPILPARTATIHRLTSQYLSGPWFAGSGAQRGGQARRATHLQLRRGRGNGASGHAAAAD